MKSNAVKALIVDDESRARRVLAQLILDYCPEVEVVGEAEDIPSAVIKINETNPDVVFLDIEMPNFSGFRIMDFFKEINFEIVFVTAYDKYAIKAFEVSALDYLLKPIQVEDLERSIKKLERKIESSRISERIETLKHHLQNDSFDKIMVPVAEGFTLVKTSDIYSIEAEGAYSKIHFEDNNFLLVSKRLKFFENIFDGNGDFYRTHRSFIVNMNLISLYNRNESIVQMENGSTIPIARGSKSSFETHLKTYHK